MTGDSLPSADRIRHRFTLFAASAALSWAATASLCVYLLCDLDASDWGGFLFAVSVVTVLVGSVTGIWLRRTLQPIGHWLENADDESLSSAQARSVFKAALALPSETQRVFSVAWMLASLAVPVVATLLGGAGWGLGMRSFAVIVGGVTAATVMGFALFFASKREIEPARSEMARWLPDAAERRACVRHIPIARKMATALVGTVAALLVFAMGLTHARSQSALDEVVLQWEVKLLGAVASRVEENEFEKAVSITIGDRSLLTYPIAFALLEEGVAFQGVEELGRLREEILGQVAAGTTQGSYAKLHQEALWAWRALPDGRTAVARVARDDIYSQTTSMVPALGLVLLISLGVVFMISTMISSDLGRSIALLRASAETMASGDLRRGHIHESEDELGELWRSFETMANAFRTTVASLADAADRVDAAANEIDQVAGGVAGASEEQVRRIQQASELMVSINSQVMEVAGSAQELNIAVEESSSSILELGAAGDELNDTASVLGTKVDEVSGSIEQMVRSVKQVSSSSDGLADAAAETSASMEEMASAMRAVDTTAELTASLSRNVVGSAETGQEKVSQTIDGMRAIRDATDTAEGVIRGLGARTQEIGAILDVIDDVAEETNLLALNAAIIAAQAGEHGRAFSVVADEIKELADRVLASTKEIGGLIKSVQDESDNAVGAIEVGSRSVASGVELSAAAGLSLDEITSSSRESGQRIGEIVSAVREQTKAASHVVALMDTVRDGVTAIVSASADQDRGNEVVYRSSATMRDVTQQVRRTTEEQSRGFVRIRESIEGVREVVENINGSLQEQSTACSQVAQFLEQVFERTRSNEDAARSMRESIRGLVSQAEGLRENVVKFRI